MKLFVVGRKIDSEQGSVAVLELLHETNEIRFLLEVLQVAEVEVLQSLSSELDDFEGSIGCVASEVAASSREMA